MRRTAIYSALFLMGCANQPTMKPWPCDKIMEVPGLRKEMESLRDADFRRQQLGMAPTTLLLRNYAKAASSKCAADRDLGAARITPEIRQEHWWTRFWEWITS